MPAFNSSNFAPRGNFLGSDTVFIKDQWEDEIWRELQNQYMMMQTVIEVPQEKLTGTTLHQPKVGLMAVNNVAIGSPVNLQAYQEDEFTMEFKRYQESSFAIHDIATLWNDYDLRAEYTREVANALTRDMDNWILGYRAVLQRLGNFVTATQADGTTPAPLNTRALLAAKLAMDLQLVDPSERMWIISPSQHTSLLSVPEFISGDFITGQPVMTGQVGMLYGSPVIVNNNLKMNSLTGERVITGVDGNGKRTFAQRPTPGSAATGNVSPWFPNRNLNGDLNGAGQHTELVLANTLPASRYTALYVRKGWLKFGFKQRPRTEIAREVSHLSDIVVTTCLYDAKIYRPENGILIHSAEAV